MKTKEFIDIFVEEMEIDGVEVTPETQLTSLEEWDSMGVMIAIGIASERFDVTLTSKDMKDLTTVRSLMNKIGKEHFED